MKKFAKIIYILNAVLALIMILTLSLNHSVNISTSRCTTDYNIMTDYDSVTFYNTEAPIGITEEYRYTLQNIPSYNGCIAFYLAHQQAEAYLDGELVYQLSLDKEHSITKSPGYEWVEIYIDEADEGKELVLHIHPSYKSSLSTNFTVYFGDTNAIRSHLIRMNLPLLLVAALAIILGIVFIIYFISNIRNENFDRSIFMLGLFSIVTGMWKMCDMTIAPIIFSNSLLLSTIAIFAITMMVVPFLIFIQHQLHKEDNSVWTITSILCNLVAITITLLQLSGIADLRETLPVSHIMILFIVVFIMANVAREAKRTSFSNKMKLTTFCSILCLAGVIIDLAVYYLYGNSGNMIYCLLAFLIYAIFMGLMAAKETKQLIDLGHQAERFENLAFHDTLTGLYNRAFYYEFLNTHNVRRGNCFIIMMDVNNLKKCNDTMGHDCGDELLIHTARLIKEAFPIGDCLRLGGDEFCVLLSESSIAECKHCLDTFEQLSNDFNNTHKNTFPVSVAYGYANFNPTSDLDFSDTLRRADRMMYQMKMSMKH